MRTLKLFFFLIPLVIGGCKGPVTKTGKQDQPGSMRPGGKEIITKHSSISNCSSTIINNEFGFDVLAFKVFKADTTKIKSLFLNPVILKLEKQRDQQGYPYYLYHFTDGINKLILFNNNGFYLKDGEIRNDKVLLNKKISIGMAKGDLLKLLKATSIKCDSVIVKNDELSFETVYIFNNSKLKQVNMGDIVE